jgi:hypothetical protein
MDAFRLLVSKVQIRQTAIFKTFKASSLRKSQILDVMRYRNIEKNIEFIFRFIPPIDEKMFSGKYSASGGRVFVAKFSLGKSHKIYLMRR